LRKLCLRRRIGPRTEEDTVTLAAQRGRTPAQPSLVDSNAA